MDTPEKEGRGQGTRAHPAAKSATPAGVCHRRGSLRKRSALLVGRRHAAARRRLVADIAGLGLRPGPWHHRAGHRAGLAAPTRGFGSWLIIVKPMTRAITAMTAMTATNTGVETLLFIMLLPA